MGILAGIAHYDFPLPWPTALQDICNLVKSGEPLVRTKGLKLLYLTYKSILGMTKKSDTGEKRKLRKTQFQAQAPAMFSLLVPVWMESTTSMLSQLSVHLQVIISIHVG